MKVRLNWMQDPLLHLLLIAAVVAGVAQWRREWARRPHDGAVLAVRLVEPGPNAVAPTPAPGGPTASE